MAHGKAVSSTPGGTMQQGIPSRGRFPLLDRVDYPSDLRNLSTDQLKQVAD
ncbi:hypothetical protein GGR01_002834, partial [Acetobacter oeni]|nr:hypothetical protein [Acetobacter oeni]